MREVEWFRPSSIFRRTWHALMFSLPSSGRELGQMHNGPPAFSKQQCLLFPQEQMQPPQSFQLCWNKRFSNCFCILSTLMDETDECSLNLNHFYCQIQQHIAMLHFFVLGMLKYSIGWRPQIALIDDSLVGQLTTNLDKRTVYRVGNKSYVRKCMLTRIFRILQKRQAIWRKSSLKVEHFHQKLVAVKSYFSDRG